LDRTRPRSRAQGRPHHRRPGAEPAGPRAPRQRGRRYALPGPARCRTPRRLAADHRASRRAAQISGHCARRASKGRDMKLTDKLKAMAAAIGAIEKQFGKGAVMRLGEGELGQKVEIIPSGSIGLDVALGCGGYPRGRVIEIYGPESSGKTTLTLHAIAQVQAGGGCAAFIDAEHALDVNYAKKLGVKVEDLLISQPDTGEQAL